MRSAGEDAEGDLVVGGNWFVYQPGDFLGYSENNSVQSGIWVAYEKPVAVSEEIFGFVKEAHSQDLAHIVEGLGFVMPAGETVGVVKDGKVAEVKLGHGGLAFRGCNVTEL
jgi:hypothetical protein